MGPLLSNIVIINGGVSLHKLYGHVAFQSLCETRSNNIGCGALYVFGTIDNDIDLVVLYILARGCGANVV